MVVAPCPPRRAPTTSWRCAANGRKNHIVTSLPDIAPGAYRAAGLIANPFQPHEPFHDADEPGVKLISHAAANEFLRALDELADKSEPAPVWVEKAGNLPAAYYVGPLAESLGVLGSNAAGTDLMAAYVPLDMMRLGRVRAVLSAVAEHVAGVDVDLTLATWLRAILAAPDTEIPEYEAIASCDLEALDKALESDPGGTMERYFGPCVGEREGVEDLEILMRIGTARLDALETDVAEEVEPETGEAPDDALSEAFTRHLGPEEEQPRLEAGETEPEDGLPRADDLVAYYVAHVAKHLSPVLARALRAYRAQGTTSMTQELKVTKAPTKTLAALVRLATCRYRKVVIIFDRFDIWPTVPDDLRLKMLGTFSQLRWALRDGGLLAFVVSSGNARELDEQFGSATRVVWDLPGLADVAGENPAYQPELAQCWVEAATIAGHEAMDVREGPLLGLAGASDGSLRHTATLLAAAIGNAVARGASEVDEEDAAAALAAVSGDG